MRTTIAAAHPRTIHAPLAEAECTKAGKQGCFIVTSRAPQSQPIVTTLSTTLRGLVCIDLATLLTTTHTATRLAVATDQILQRTAKAAIVFPSFVLCFEQAWELLPETRLAVQQAIRAAIARLSRLLWTMPGDTPPSGWLLLHRLLGHNLTHCA